MPLPVSLSPQSGPRRAPSGCLSSTVYSHCCRSVTKSHLTVTPRAAARQASLSYTISRSLLRLKSVCHPTMSSSISPSPPNVHISYLLNRYRMTDVENKYLDTNGERKWCKELGDWDWHIDTTDGDILSCPIWRPRATHAFKALEMWPVQLRDCSPNF